MAKWGKRMEGIIKRGPKMEVMHIVMCTMHVATYTMHIMDASPYVMMWVSTIVTPFCDIPRNDMALNVTMWKTAHEGPRISNYLQSHVTTCCCP